MTPQQLARQILPRGLRRAGRLTWFRLQQHDPVLRASYDRLRALRNAYAGQRCFLMGNGPSLNQTPLDKLVDDYVWGFNRCYLLYDRLTWRPAFYTAVDTLVVPDIAHEIRVLLDQPDEMLFFFPATFYWQGVLPPHPRIIWFFELGIDPADGALGYFAPNAAQFVRTTNTVSITALQLAAFLGFNPIYLIGCDTHYLMPAETLASGTAIDPGTREQINGYELLATRDNDPNHFDPRYFGAGQRWHYPNVNGMIHGYTMAQRVCTALGVQVYNATVNGALEVFPRVEFTSLFA